MARRKLLLFLKPFDIYPAIQSSGVTNSKILCYLDERLKVHKEAISFCQKILQKKPVDWQPIFRNKFSQPIRDVDLVVTVGGDGTLLQASHLMDDSIPILGLNSDPTQLSEVEELRDEFDATRSTGYLCAANVNNFENILDSILDGQTFPSELSRISVCVNSKPLSNYALNDILIAHPCPATVSRFSFRIKRGEQPCSPFVNSRSSGLRVSTAAGSTAAMLSAGGFAMPVLSRDLQYMVREPISPGRDIAGLMHGVMKSDQFMNTSWFTKDGLIYIDGSHVSYPIQFGDSIEISARAPGLLVFLPSHLLLENNLPSS